MGGREVGRRGGYEKRTAETGIPARVLPYPSMTALSAADVECIEQRHFYKEPPVSSERRQLERQIVGAGKRCRHGWPQAIMYDVLYREKPNKSYRLGDMVRLTCPLLVDAIDKLEKAGAMAQYNERLGPG